MTESRWAGRIPADRNQGPLLSGRRAFAIGSLASLAGLLTRRQSTQVFAGPPADASSAPTTASAGAAHASVMSEGQARATIQSLVDMAVERMPREYRGKKDWEKTKRVWGGLKVRREGLRITTNRRWRDVRHGTQSHYVVSLSGNAAAPPPLKANVRSVTASSDAWQISCDVASPLDFSARVERWNRGLRIYSVKIEGYLKVRLDLAGTVAARPDYSEVPPAIVIVPRVSTATLHLDSLEVNRVSKVGGEVAEQWGEIAEAIVQQVLMDDINQKLPDKLNRAIEKKQDELRFSAMDWVGKLTKAKP